MKHIAHSISTINVLNVETLEELIQNGSKVFILGNGETVTITVGRDGFWCSKLVVTLPNGRNFALKLNWLGNKIKTELNNELLANVFNILETYPNPIVKFQLLNLVASIDPINVRKLLGVRDSQRGFVPLGIIGQDDKLTSMFDTVDAFKSSITEILGDKIVEECEEMIKSTYGNLKLGNFVDGERKRLDISESNFSRLGKMSILHSLARRNAASWWRAPTERLSGAPWIEVPDEEERQKGAWPNRSENIDMSSIMVFRKEDFQGLTTVLPKKIRFDRESRSFVNADKTMEAALRDGGPISIFEAQSLGLITPEKAKELQRSGRTEFLPVYISFRATEKFNDYVADVKNILNKLPNSVKDADALAKLIISKLQPGVIPIFTGHSMGGMLAHSMGTKYNYASIGFNPLGLGTGVREFLGQDKCVTANDALHAECHSSFIMRGDWVSDEEGSKIARIAVKKPYVGQRYVMPNESGIKGTKLHRYYVRNIKRLVPQTEIPQLLLKN
jgi:hypothetical protein